jgi:hypothetical protein
MRTWSPSGNLNLCDDGNPCATQREWVTVRYSKPVFPLSVLVYEKFYAGNTVLLDALAPDNTTWVPLWQGERSAPADINIPRVFAPLSCQPAFRTNVIR